MSLLNSFIHWLLNSLWIKMAIIRKLKIIPVLLMILIGTGCEAMFMVVCGTNQALTWDKTLDTQVLPKAKIGEYYEFVLEHPQDQSYMEWLLDTKQGNLPTGLELVMLESDDEQSEKQNHYRSWILKGIPEKAGKYKFYIKGIPFRVMCGNRDYYYPYALEVLSAN